MIIIIVTIFHSLLKLINILSIYLLNLKISIKLLVNFSLGFSIIIKIIDNLLSFTSIHYASLPIISLIFQFLSTAIKLYLQSLY